MIVGGYALAFHGSPRFTGDIDIFIKPDFKNARQVLSVLSEFGFADLGLKAEDFELPDNKGHKVSKSYDNFKFFFYGFLCELCGRHGVLGLYAWECYKLQNICGAF